MYIQKLKINEGQRTKKLLFFNNKTQNPKYFILYWKKSYSHQLHAHNILVCLMVFFLLSLCHTHTQTFILAAVCVYVFFLNKNLINNANGVFFSVHFWKAHCMANKKKWSGKRCYYINTTYVDFIYVFCVCVFCCCFFRHCIILCLCRREKNWMTRVKYECLHEQPT